MLNLSQKAGPYIGRFQADTVAVIVLAANAEQHFNIPAGANIAIFSATAGNFYCLTNGQTAAVPAATNVAFPSPNTNPELNPTILSVTPGNLMSLISAGTPTITISFYQDTYLAETPT